MPESALGASASVTVPVEQSDRARMPTAPPDRSASALLKTRLPCPCVRQFSLVCSQAAMSGSAATAMPAGRKVASHERCK
jgi:hypothetical protein